MGRRDGDSGVAGTADSGFRIPDSGLAAALTIWNLNGSPMSAVAVETSSAGWVTRKSLQRATDSTSQIS